MLLHTITKGAVILSLYEYMDVTDGRLSWPPSVNWNVFCSYNRCLSMIYQTTFYLSAFIYTFFVGLSGNRNVRFQSYSLSWGATDSPLCK